MISVIIPTYNEEEQIRNTIRQLWANDHSNQIGEIIVSDGGSSDDTLAIARSEGVSALLSPKKGRSAQMNYGASRATQGILFFLHADTTPPADFTADISEAVLEGFDAGCYRLCFDHPHWFLRANCWFTRFDVNAFHYGDQSLFIKRDLFEKLNGRKYHGSGIGLTISRKIVEAHDGFIDAIARPDGGAVFNCYLPIDEEE